MNFDILPLKFRYFKSLIRFLFMNITKNPTSSLVKSLMSFKKTYGSLRRDTFKTPLFKTNLDFRYTYYVYIILYFLVIVCFFYIKKTYSILVELSGVALYALSSFI